MPSAARSRSRRRSGAMRWRHRTVGSRRRSPWRPTEWFELIQRCPTCKRHRSSRRPSRSTPSAPARCGWAMLRWCRVPVRSVSARCNGLAQLAPVVSSWSNRTSVGVLWPRRWVLTTWSSRARLPSQLVLERTHGLGADIVYECVGRAAAIQTAVDLARRGGSMCLIGLADGEASISPAAWLIKEISVTSSLAYFHEEFEMVMAMIADGRVDLERVAHQHGRPRRSGCRAGRSGHWSLGADQGARRPDESDVRSESHC